MCSHLQVTTVCSLMTTKAFDLIWNAKYAVLVCGSEFPTSDSQASSSADRFEPSGEFPNAFRSSDICAMGLTFHHYVPRQRQGWKQTERSALGGVSGSAPEPASYFGSLSFCRVTPLLQSPTRTDSNEAKDSRLGAKRRRGVCTIDQKGRASLMLSCQKSCTSCFEHRVVYRKITKG